VYAHQFRTIRIYQKKQKLSTLKTVSCIVMYTDYFIFALRLTKMQSIQTHPSTYAIVTLERMRNSRHMARTPYTTSILTMALRKIGNEALYARLNPPRMFPYHPLIPIPYLPLPSPWPRPWPKLQTKPHNHGFFRNVSLPHKKGREKSKPPIPA
jgi:hypothetical protein